MDIETPVHKNPIEIDEKEYELPKAITTIKSHPLDNVLGDLSKGVQMRSQVQNIVNHLSFLSQIEPKTAKEALLDEDWISAMQEELLQFSRSKVWELVPKPHDTSIIGLQIRQSDEGIHISQSKYCKEMLKFFEMDNAKPISTPMSTSDKLIEDPKGIPVETKKYWGKIGSLLYITTSCPDIQYRVCKCARFQVAPKESHLSVVKGILRYLKGTTNVGLWYPKGIRFGLEGVRINAREKTGSNQQGEEKNSEFYSGGRRTRASQARSCAQRAETQRTRAGQARGRARSE
ncbi:hypothetical protein AgCh_031512 [Apium graveolens]